MPNKCETCLANELLREALIKIEQLQHRENFTETLDLPDIDNRLFEFYAEPEINAYDEVDNWIAESKTKPKKYHKKTEQTKLTIEVILIKTYKVLKWIFY